MKHRDWQLSSRWFLPSQPPAAIHTTAASRNLRSHACRRMGRPDERKRLSGILLFQVYAEAVPDKKRFVATVHVEAWCPRPVFAIEVHSVVSNDVAISPWPCIVMPPAFQSNILPFCRSRWCLVRSGQCRPGKPLFATIWKGLRRTGVAGCADITGYQYSW